MKTISVLAIAILISGSTLFARAFATINVQPKAMFTILPASRNTPEDTGKSKKVSPPSIQYTCLMHPEIVSNKPGKCPKCGMTLVKKKSAVKKETAVKNESAVKSK